MKDYYFGESRHGPNYSVLEHELLLALAEVMPLLRHDVADHPATIRAYKVMQRQARRMNSRDPLAAPLATGINAVDLMRWVKGKPAQENGGELSL